MRIHEQVVRVKYSETDKMGVVHHSHYIDYFEIGRTEYLRGLGLAYSELENRGLRFVVSEVYCHYIYNVGYDEQIVIRTWISELTNTKIKFEYKVHRLKDNLPLVSGYTTLVSVDAENKIQRIPEDLYLLLKENL